MHIEVCAFDLTLYVNPRDLRRSGLARDSHLCIAGKPAPTEVTRGSR